MKKHGKPRRGEIRRMTVCEARAIGVPASWGVGSKSATEDMVLWRSGRTRWNATTCWVPVALTPEQMRKAMERLELFWDLDNSQRGVLVRGPAAEEIKTLRAALWQFIRAPSTPEALKRMALESLGRVG